jgi:hypothetical protein
LDALCAPSLQLFRIFQQPAKAPKAPKVSKSAATGVRAKAARRTAEANFSKVIFNQIGGRERPRFAAMTWTERDAFVTKPENAAVAVPCEF